jgi:hypothetical protein
MQVAHSCLDIWSHKWWSESTPFCLSHNPEQFILYIYPSSYHQFLVVVVLVFFFFFSILMAEVENVQCSIFCTN